ncbi:Uncharacterised protein [Providencia rettgeri]|uniref:Uncharacterized protein n=1 Tax=Providencia rettgeri TaxID=587 RepID=A0A9N8GW33_PRORE|nr:hypothetical protein [Providencia rettgeri]CAB5551376.1 Uncharacterised protein [Providencia rettgeri]CAB5659838.1 Uncharacterised protein [Providencia rettgeri]CAB5665606.1 Uncharacterised protein [Providencia rettgeri]CAC9153412.1 Uncharacterised protein [Providencia rettgeri]
MNGRDRRQGDLELISIDLSNVTRILIVSKNPELMYD